MWENEKEPETKNKEVLRTQLCPPKGDTLLAPPRAHGPHDTRPLGCLIQPPLLLAFFFSSLSLSHLLLSHSHKPSRPFPSPARIAARVDGQEAPLSRPPATTSVSCIH